MDELQLKRESYHIEIRRKRIERFLNTKRQKPEQIEDHHYRQNYLSIIGLASWEQALLKLNSQLKRPLIEMTQNMLAKVAVEELSLSVLSANWPLHVAILRYLVTFSQLRDDVLQPYVKDCDMLVRMAAYFNQLVQMIEADKIVIVGQQSNQPMEQSETYQERVSYTFTKCSWILMNLFCEVIENRRELLKNHLFVSKVYRCLQIKMDSEVLLQHLKFICSLLNGLDQMIDKQSTHLQQPFLTHAQIFINPICQALQTPNESKLQEVLLILNHLCKVGQRNEYLNQIFKFMGGKQLIWLIQNEAMNQDIQFIVLQIICEIAYQSLTHLDILVNNGLLEFIGNKLHPKQSNKVQFQALWVLEYVSSQKHSANKLFQNELLLDLICSKLFDSDSVVAEQACLTVCSMIHQCDYSQIGIFCDQRRRVQFQLVEHLERGNPTLYNAIVSAIITIMHAEGYKNVCYLPQELIFRFGQKTEGGGEIGELVHCDQLILKE